MTDRTRDPAGIEPVAVLARDSERSIISHGTRAVRPWRPGDQCANVRSVTRLLRSDLATERFSVFLASRFGWGVAVRWWHWSGDGRSRGRVVRRRRQWGFDSWRRRIPPIPTRWNDLLGPWPIVTTSAVASSAWSRCSSSPCGPMCSVGSNGMLTRSADSSCGARSPHSSLRTEGPAGSPPTSRSWSWPSW